MSRIVFAFLFTLMLAIPSQAAPYRMISLGLYQDNDTLSHRIPEVSGLSDYIKDLNLTAAVYLEAVGSRFPQTFEIVVAIRPSGKSKVWIISSRDKFDDEKGLTEALEKVTAPKPKDGPVAICLLSSLSNAPDEKKLTQPGIPASWMAAIKTLNNPPQLLDKVLPLVWKE